MAAPSVDPRRLFRPLFIPLGVEAGVSPAEIAVLSSTARGRRYRRTRLQVFDDTEVVPPENKTAEKE
jgi:hypothetical protein